MKKSSEEVKKFDEDLEQQEMLELEIGLQSFNQKKINGQLISPFDQWLISKKISGITQEGQIVCFEPALYRKWSKINSKLEFKNYVKEKKKMDADPMLKIDFLARIAEIRKSIIEKN